MVDALVASAYPDRLALACPFAVGYQDGFESVRQAICHHDYAKLNMVEFFFAECVYCALPVE
jgi:hypothetical protein